MGGSPQRRYSYIQRRHGVGVCVSFFFWDGRTLWKAALLSGSRGAVCRPLTIRLAGVFAPAVQLPDCCGYWVCAAGMYVEALWRRDQRVRAKDPRAVVGG